MKSLGKKTHPHFKSLGVKSNFAVQTIGNKTPTGLATISNVIAPNRPELKITGLYVSNIIPNHSNKSDNQYMPTGARHSLEKRKKK